MRPYKTCRQTFGNIFQQHGRLPSAYFTPYKFGKDAVLKDENVFSSKKNTLPLSHFVIFPTLKNFQFFAKNS